jgi:hypothetical protein
MMPDQRLDTGLPLIYSVCPRISMGVYMRRIALTVLVFSLLLSGVYLYSQTNVVVERSLENKERVGWQAWKDHNPRQIEGMITNDSINIADGMVVKGKQ